MEKAASDRFFDTLDTLQRGYIEGEVAVPFMLQSKLPEEILAQVWRVQPFFSRYSMVVLNVLLQGSRRH